MKICKAASAAAAATFILGSAAFAANCNTSTPAQTENERREKITVVCEYEYKPLCVDYEPIALEDVNEDDAVLIAKTMYGEYRNAENYRQCSAVAWCVLNRLDNGGFGDSVREVVTAPYQFLGYREQNPVDAELYAIACDVLARHNAEKWCICDVGRTLPKEYLWFSGNGKTNIYRDAYSGGNEWS